ncbi:hypothetical protein BU24DRAFT_480844 [Aaosphaeria arxii CBS 175.79]|uniref:Uncharacterized protein n=1 Tax=Aaosphaeria arxii CBS 175.79 TaxID=1450172 RepID=A0A6A5XTJ8_9PLEO|nr:uncharacterized protein BU24DRAFT_480844 [Aaosphaeria arxii CBS 175.79]KAF2016239.1 hypothetical protein BU24DRAFT_480844 [Aaosphaeria arxii CBS 175.79]
MNPPSLSLSFIPTQLHTTANTNLPTQSPHHSPQLSPQLPQNNQLNTITTTITHTHANTHKHITMAHSVQTAMGVELPKVPAEKTLEARAAGRRAALRRCHAERRERMKAEALQGKGVASTKQEVAFPAAKEATVANSEATGTANGPASAGVRVKVEEGEDISMDMSGGSDGGESVSDEDDEEEDDEEGDEEKEEEEADWRTAKNFQMKRDGGIFIRKYDRYGNLLLTRQQFFHTLNIFLITSIIMSPQYMDRKAGMISGDSIPATTTLPSQMPRQSNHAAVNNANRASVDSRFTSDSTSSSTESPQHGDILLPHYEHVGRKRKLCTPEHLEKRSLLGPR